MDEPIGKKMDRYAFTFRHKGVEYTFYIRAYSLDEAVCIRDAMSLARYDGKTPGAVPWASRISLLRRKK